MVPNNQQKFTSPSCLVLAHGSAGEPVRQPVRDKVCDTSASGTKFEVGGQTFGEDIPRRASLRAALAAVVEN